MRRILVKTIFVASVFLAGCSDDEPVKVEGETGAIQYMTEKCRNNESEFKLTGFTRERYNSFCSCYWKKMVMNYPPDEQEYFEKYGKNSMRLEEIQVEALTECGGPKPRKLNEKQPDKSLNE